MLWVASAFGLAGGLLAGLLEGLMLSPDRLLPGTPRTTLLMAALGVGIIEEACKFVPLSLVIFKRRYFNEHTDGVIYFALTGLSFGLTENILYTLHFGSRAGLLRVFLTPIFHAAITAMVGYFLAKRKVAHQSPFGVWLPLAAAMILHGLYDFGLLSGSGLYAAGSLLITLGMSSGLFVLFLLANRQDQNKGLSALTASGQPKDEVKALLALLFGITGIIGALFMALIGLVLGISGMVMGTMSRSSNKRGLSTAGLVLSSVAILAGLATWTHALKQNTSLNQISPGTPLHRAQSTAPSVLTADLSTPCYSVGFIDKLNVSNSSESCDMQAFNGPEIATSTDAYKIYVNKSTIADADAFTGIAKQALDKDVKDSLPNFSITTERVASFAGSPAYMVNVFNKAQGVAVIEAAVLHKEDNASNVFILVHAINSRTADLNILEAGWQWK